ncbi:MAG: DUF6340 family protein [Salibacteraceae bacterium]
MEIKPFIRFLIASIVYGFGLVGCSSTKVAVNVILPPESPLSEPVETIAFIDAMNVGSAQTNQYVNGTVVAQFNGSSSYLVKNTFAKMESNLNSGLLFQTFDTTLNFIPKSGTFKSNPIPWQVMRKACEVLNTDVIITIEGYTADIDSDSEVRYSTPVDRNYGTVRVPYFDGEQSVDMRMLFRAYSCKWKIGELDSQSEVSTQSTMSATGSTPYEVSQNMQSGGSILLDASHKIADDYCAQIGPRRESQSRKLYIKGNDQMLEAFSQVKITNWKGANDIWYLLATSNNKSIASKATYNLIVGNEALGNYSEAFELAQICINKYQMKHVTPYVQLLKKRQAETLEVKRLFPALLF